MTANWKLVFFFWTNHKPDTLYWVIHTILIDRVVFDNWLNKAHIKAPGQSNHPKRYHRTLSTTERERDKQYSGNDLKMSRKKTFYEWATPMLDYEPKKRMWYVRDYVSLLKAMISKQHSIFVCSVLVIRTVRYILRYLRCKVGHGRYLSWTHWTTLKNGEPSRQEKIKKIEENTKHTVRTVPVNVASLTE